MSSIQILVFVAIVYLWKRKKKRKSGLVGEGVERERERICILPPSHCIQLLREERTLFKLDKPHSCTKFFALESELL